jgi:methylphosphotriester-DNA--protein-cysteine methyltransferase
MGLSLTAMHIDDEIRYRALAARDARFDGLFFVGVTSTWIYYRPTYTARCPGRDRCRFFSNSALAERGGFRLCLRCRPELAPGYAPIDAVWQTARAAAGRIEAGALNDGGSLSARPDMIASHLSTNVRLAGMATRFSGVRMPGAFDSFEKSPKQLRETPEAWRPWRAYAAM